MDLLKDLNPEQEQAVTYHRGPLIIVAGAGTGKTTVITRRIAWLIQKGFAKPSEILALTFTDKAAGEMEERVDELVPYGFVDTWISTFHSFGDRILRLYPLEVGLSPDFKVLSKPEQAVFLRENWFRFKLDHLRPLANPLRYIPEIINYIARLKDEDITPLAHQKYVKKLFKKVRSKEEKKVAKLYKELSEFYATYQQLLLERDLVDFGDQIVLLLKLFRSEPKILQKYQKQFKYILVDEFQDTNSAQNELLKLLAKGGAPNLTVVGDDDQSIYKFRGAAISNIMDFKKNYPKAKIIVITQNYRSSQTILDSAYKLIKNNDPYRLEERYNLNKKLMGKRGGKKISQIHFISDNEEANFIAQTIKKGTDGGRPPGDFAVLVRTNEQAINLIENFDYYGIPYKFAGATGLYRQPEIRLILSFIKSLTDTGDSLSLYELLTSSIYELDPEELIEILSFAKRNNLSLWQIIKNLNNYELPPISKRTIAKTEKVKGDLILLRSKAGEASAGRLIYQFLDKTGYLKKLTSLSEKKVEAKTALKNLVDFFNQVQDFEKSAQSPSIFNFEKNIQLLKDVGENPASSAIEPEEDSVTISTVHLAKGLEWPIVFLTNLVQDRFPTRQRGETFKLAEKLVKQRAYGKDFHLEEERRLFYVGMTRAKEELYLTSAEIYEGNPRPKKLSQFVIEAMEDINKNPISLKIPHFEKISLFEGKPKILKIVTQFKTKGLSREQIDDYLSCPKKFEYKHILQLPLPLTWQMGYGQALHTSIAAFLKASLQRRKFTELDLMRIFEKNWSSLNFVHKQQEEKKKKIGKNALINFYKKELSNPREILGVEENFEVEVLEKFKIRGRFDSVFKEKGTLKILDFKSSEVEDEEQALKRLKDNRQLKIYSLAYEKLKGITPFVGLYFIEKGLEVSHQFPEPILNKTKLEIETVKVGVEKANFKAKPSFGECRICPYKTICPFSKAK